MWIVDQPNPAREAQEDREARLRQLQAKRSRTPAEDVELEWGLVDGKPKRVKSYRAEWSKEQAQEALAKVLLQIEAPKPQGAGITLEQGAERYNQAKARKKSVAEMARVLESFKRDFGADTPLASITASRISEWEAGRLATTSRQTGKLLSQAAVNRPLATLRAMLRMACDKWEVVAKVPHIKLEKEDQSRLRWLTAGEGQGRLTACHASRNPHLADLVEFCLFTGLRQAEALGLTWDRVE